MKFMILLAFLASVHALTSLTTVYEWKQLTFDWPNDAVREDAIASSSYIPENSAPVGLITWKSKLFVTVPRWKSGVPASLTYIDRNQTTEGSPNLIPYPNWESHDLQNYSSQSIVSAFRLAIDLCERLWVIDTGFDGFLGNKTVYSTPSIIIFDLNTDQIIHRYNLKDTDQTDTSIFGNIVLDIDENNCDNTYAYLTDVLGYGLVVYSLSQNDSWRFTHNFFYFEPLLGNLYMKGLNYQMHDGIFGSALGPKEHDGYRTLYFHPFISYNEFSVNTRTLQNSSLAQNNDYYSWKLEGFKGENAASLVSVFDDTTNTLISSQPNQNGVACWNPRNSLNPNTFNLVAQDNETLLFPSDIKIDENRNIWVFTDRAPLFTYSQLDPNDTNFRILTGTVDDLVSGTNCVSDGH